MATNSLKKDEQKFGNETNVLKINDRFSELRYKLKLSKDALGAIAGVSGTAIGNIENGKTKSPSADVIAAISIKLGISTDWLLTGEGEMLASDAEAQKVLKYPAGQRNVEAYKALSDIPVIYLPHVSFKARASIGYAQLQRFKDTDIFDKVLFRLPPGRTAEDYQDAVVFDIEGDSMEPSLRDGQQVIAWPIPDSKWEYLHNTTCVVDYGENVTVKAIFKNELNNMDGLTLHATGGRGGSFVVERKDIHSIWEVREFFGVVPYRLS
jgi:transcriptional regulator with XRE-family HTH domain